MKLSEKLAAIEHDDAPPVAEASAARRPSASDARRARAPRVAPPPRRGRRRSARCASTC